MYCGNCGQEIEGTASFCPVCGKPVEAKEEPKSKTNSTKIIKYILMGISTLLVAVIVFFVAKMIIFYFGLPSDEEIRINSNNLANGGMFASDGKWLYYYDRGICRVKLSTGKQEVVLDEVEPEEMFMLGDDLYYYTFPGYSKLGEEDSKPRGTEFNLFSKNCVQTDGKFFYTCKQDDYDESGVFATKCTNRDYVKKLSDIRPTSLLFDSQHVFIISGFTRINDQPNDYYGTWCVDKNGGTPIQLFDKPNGWLIMTPDSVLYADDEHRLCSIHPDGTEKMVYENVFVAGGLNATDDYIFYVDYDSENIWRMNIDGTERIRLNTFQSTDVYIAGDWIIYRNLDFDGEIYKMSFDGSENRPIY